jgi:succinoglycan biosynthesis transport protein ExoP
MTTIPTTMQERVPMPPMPMAPAAGGGPKTLTPADIISMIKQRLVMIIILSIFFGACAVGLFMLAWVKFPEYAADSMIECISDRPKESFSPYESQLNQDAYTRFVMTQAVLIKSDPILRQVLKDPEVRATQWFRSIDQDQLVSELSANLGCQPVRDTNYIEVSMATRDKQDPHRIVNTVVKVYLAEVRERAANQYRQELTEYKRELSDLRDQIQKKNKEIAAFRQNIPAGEAVGTGASLGQGVLLRKLEQDQSTVAEYEQQTAELQSLMEIYANPQGQPVNPEDKLQVEQDPRVAQLDAQVFSLEQEMQIHLQKFGENHREYRQMVIRRDEAREQLAKVRANRLREILEFKQQQIETAFYNSQNALMLARERLQETQAKQGDLERKLTDFNIMMGELELLTETQTRLEDYIREIDRIVRERNAVRVRSAVPAVAPIRRSFPSIFMLPALLIAAFAGAVGLSLGLELLDNSVKTGRDVTRHLDLAILGSIPDIDDEEVEIEHVESAVRDAPHSMVTEAFRAVRGNLQFSAPADRMRSIVVTSPKPEDGRTTVAANLAASLAVGGRRVLLVDANLRRPALHRIYEQIGALGLTNILIGESNLRACVHKTDLANLDVIGSGPIPPNPAELLGSEYATQFLAEATAGYDHVIIDSAPVLLASDAAVLATLVDGTILVYRAKVNSRGVALRARTMLEHVGAHIFGAVLNVAQARRGGYFREQLRTFYEYQQEDDDEKRPPALPGDATERLASRSKQDSDTQET